MNWPSEELPAKERIRRRFTGLTIPPAVIVPAAFLAVLVLFYYQVIFFGKSFVPVIPGASVLSTGPYGFSGSALPDYYRPDLGAMSWGIAPWSRKVSAEYQAGTFPLWDDNQGFGTPLLANAQSGGLDLLRLPVLVSSSALAWDIYYLTRTVLGCLFAYMFARQLQLRRIASFGFAIAYLYSGHFLMFGDMHWVEIYLLLPPILSGVEIVMRGRVPWLGTLIVALTVALAILAGMPEVTLLVLLFATAYSGFRWLWADVQLGARMRVVRLVQLGCGWLAGVLLAAPVLLPLAEFVPISFSVHPTSRGLGLAAASTADLAFMGIPYLDGTPVESIIHSVGRLDIQTYEGASVLVLAFFGIMASRDKFHRRLAMFLTLSIALLLLKTYGAPEVNELGRLPGLNVTWFPRWSAPITSFCVALLAGLGIHQLYLSRASLKRGLVAAAVFVLYLAYSVTANWTFVQASPTEHLIDTIGIAGLFATLTFAATSLTWIGSPERRAVVCCCLIVGELWFYAPRNSYQDRTDQFITPPFVTFLQNEQSIEPFRVFATNGNLYPNIASAFGLDDIRALDALYSERYLTYVKTFLAPGASDRYTGSPSSSTEGPTAMWNNPWFDLTGARYVVTNPGTATVPPGLPPAPPTLIGAFLQANPMSASVAGIQQTTFTIDGDTRQVLFEHPPATLRLPVTISRENSSFSFAIALSPHVWDPSKGDGVEFDVAVEGPGFQKVLFQREINPKNDPSQRHWIDADLDLSSYIGTGVVVILSTRPVGSPDYDWAGWGNPILSPSHVASITQYSLVYDREVEIFENHQAMPRAFFVDSVISAADESTALVVSQAPDVDPSRVAIVEGAPSVEASTATNGSGTVKVIAHHPMDVTLEAETASPSYLVLTDSYYPGWVASIDGAPTRTYPTDIAFTGIFVPAGTHHLEFRYDPTSFRLGILVAAVTLASALVWIFLRVRPWRGSSDVFRDFDERNSPMNG